MLSRDLPPDVQIQIGRDVLATHDVGLTAQRRNLPKSTVATVARKFGWPDYGEMARTLPTAPGRGRIDALLDQVQGVPGAAPLVEQLETIVEQLAKLLQAERRRAAAAKARMVKEVELERFRARAAELEAELQRMDSAPEPDRHAVRAWALPLGLCKASGVVPKAAIDAYKAAHP
jgi:hypothetical protein